MRNRLVSQRTGFAPIDIVQEAMAAHDAARTAASKDPYRSSMATYSRFATRVDL